MLLKSILSGALLLVLFIARAAIIRAQTSGAPAATFATPAESSAGAATLAPGTRITLDNWQPYRQFMSDGVQALFEGKYFWKIPADAEIQIGRTRVNLPPKSFLEATEKYSAQVKLVELPEGALTLAGYQGGFPFPSPSDPHKGWEILADLWYRYFSHTTVITHGGGCSIDRNGATNCAAGDIVYRQLSYNTDTGVPATIPGARVNFLPSGT
jgi:hypothetical protein